MKLAVGEFIQPPIVKQRVSMQSIIRPVRRAAETCIVVTRVLSPSAGLPLEMSESVMLSTPPPLVVYEIPATTGESSNPFVQLANLSDDAFALGGNKPPQIGHATRSQPPHPPEHSQSQEGNYPDPTSPVPDYKQQILAVNRQRRMTKQERRHDSHETRRKMRNESNWNTRSFQGAYPYGYR